MSPVSVLKQFFSPSRQEEQAANLYITLVHQSRNSFFYEQLGVPDSIDGRYDLIVLHVSLAVLALQRFKTPATTKLAQGLIETLLGDMDRSLREMGVGDMGVGRRVRKMADAFYGRLRAYESALAADTPTPMVEAITRNVYRTVSEVAPTAPAQLANIARQTYEAFTHTPTEEFLENRLRFQSLGNSM